MHNAPKNQCDHFINKIMSWADSKPDSTAIAHKINDAWETFTWKDYLETTMQIANGLIVLGFEKNDCASIIARNRPEWIFAQMGIMAAGGISSSVYTTNSSVEAAFIIHHSDSKFVFAEDEIQYQKIIQEIKNLPLLKKIILMDEVKGRDPDLTMSLSDLKGLGLKQKNRDILNDRIRSIKGSDTAFYIYTSGTTGNPKAVISHNDGLSFMGKALLKRFPSPKTRLLSYLPLSHIAEQTITNIVHLETGGEVYMCPQIEKMKDYLSEVNPTMLLGVPRVWEKVEAALNTRFNELSPIKSALLKLSRMIEFKCFTDGSKTGETINPIPRKIANRLILSKIRNQLGLKNLQYAFTGAAPISKSTQEFFASLGIPLYEGYGLSESLGVAIATIPGRIKPGSIGYPLEGVDVRIASDGEILLRSPANSPGYYKDSAATAELIQDGWVHSGDIGVQDPDGSFRITDRKKEIIVTAGGKNVAPSKIEGYLKAIPLVSQAVVIGDRRPFLTALLTINETNGSPLETGLDHKIADYIEEVNKLLPRDETIKRFKILPGQFSIETGEMTPTQKIKRRVISTKYSGVIEELYRYPLTSHNA